jgi:transcriptional regulator with XRE-family HTH domain
MARAKTDGERQRMVAFGRVLAVLRTTAGLSQSALAKRSGVKRASISEYEHGKTAPDASTLERLLAGMGLRWSALDFGAWFIERLEADCRLPGSTGSAPLSLPIASSLAERIYTDLSLAHNTAAALSRLVAALEGEEEASAPILAAPGESLRNKERALAQGEWNRLKTLSRKDQAEALRTIPPELLWALSELLCIESQRLCGSDLLQAASLSELALAAATLAPGKEAFRAKLQGIAWAHIGNVSRAVGDLHAAESAFASAENLWREGEEDKDVETGLFEEGLIYALKASLRRAQRRFDEAADLLAQAEGLAGSKTFKVQVLVSRAKLLEETGHLEAAAEILAQAKEAVSPYEEPRILFAIWHNLADTLSKLERYEEASALLPEARRHCRGELNRIRLSWTEARVLTGLGAVDEGMALLARVRGEFASRSMAYDTALVSLELAVVHAKEGQPDQVKTLARHMRPIFEAQEVHREALAAVTLFRQAAERKMVTAAFAQDVLIYLRKARHAPDLQFEGGSTD